MLWARNAALSPPERKSNSLVFHDFDIQTYLNLQKLNSPFIERGRVRRSSAGA